MLTRSDLNTRFPTLSDDATVYGSDGEKLGKVVSMGEEHFSIEKGLFFPKDFTLRYDDIRDVRDGDIYVSLSSAELNDWREDSYSGWSQYDDINSGRLQPVASDTYQDKYNSLREEEVSIPVMEEKLEAQKTVRESGRVRIRKVVHTELKHLTVPVMHEEIRIERINASDSDFTGSSGSSSDFSSNEDSFKEKTIDVPLMEEEVEVIKRPVKREEVRISKERVSENRDVSGEVRQEEVEIDRDQERKRKVG